MKDFPTLPPFLDFGFEGAKARAEGKRLDAATQRRMAAAGKIVSRKPSVRPRLSPRPIPRSSLKQHWIERVCPVCARSAQNRGANPAKRTRHAFTTALRVLPRLAAGRAVLPRRGGLRGPSNSPPPFRVFPQFASTCSTVPQQWTTRALRRACSPPDTTPTACSYRMHTTLAFKYSTFCAFWCTGAGALPLRRVERRRVGREALVSFLVPAILGGFLKPETLGSQKRSKGVRFAFSLQNTVQFPTLLPRKRKTPSGVAKKKSLTPTPGAQVLASSRERTLLPHVRLPLASGALLAQPHAG